MRFCLWDYISCYKSPFHWSVIHYQVTFERHSGCGLERQYVPQLNKSDFHVR